MSVAVLLAISLGSLRIMERERAVRTERCYTLTSP